MNERNEKLKKLISGLAAGLGCMALAGALFWSSPMEVKAVPIGSDPSGTVVGGSDNTDGGEADENTDDGGSEAATGGTVTSATVTASNVNVRSDASTSASVAGKATTGMELTVTGEKADSSGTTWYAVTFESNGSTVSGYIRSDMVEAHVTEAEPVAPEEPSDEPQEETPETPAVSTDYFVQYEDDGTGNSVWYLYDSTMGTKYKIDNLLSAEEINQNNEKLMDEQTGMLRMIIVAMAAVILILIIVLTVLILKLRNSSYDDDYDDDDDDDYEDEEEDEEEDEAPRKRRFGFGRRSRDEEEDDEDEDDEEDEEEEEEYRPRRKAPVKEKPARRARYEEDDDEDEEEEYRPRRSAKTSKPQDDKSWQSKNFLDDDDLEFEFLDLK